ncbi:hypothetical protein [Nitratifractor sp.]
MDNRKRACWIFWLLLTLGYLSVGLTLFLFFLIGSISGWTFSGDSAGGIALFYAATIFLPHVLLFFGVLVWLTILSLTIWPQLGRSARLLLAGYYLLAALILWSNLSTDGGVTVRYFARKVFAPSYYPPIEKILQRQRDSGLLPLMQKEREAYARLYRTDPGDRRPYLDAYIYTRFVQHCYERKFKEEGDDRYEAYSRASALSDSIRRATVRSLSDAIEAERLEHFNYTILERIDAILELIMRYQPRLCDEVPGFDELHDAFYRGGSTLTEAQRAWKFIDNLDSRDLVLLDSHRALVADVQRGVELWKRQEDGSWRFSRSLDPHRGARRLLRRGKRLFAFFSGIEVKDRIVLYRIEGEEGKIRELSRFDAERISTFKDWDADNAGERLFIAGGYSGIHTIDYTDPLRPHRLPTRGLHRNAWSSDVLWDGKRGHLYSANHRGLYRCEFEENHLSCRDPLDGYRYDRHLKRYCRLRNGVPRCEEPVPPLNLRALLFYGEKVLAIQVLQSRKKTRLLLFDPEVLESSKTPFPSREKSLFFPLPNAFTLSAPYPQNAFGFNGRIFLPGGNRIAIIDGNLSIRRTLSTGKIYRAVPLDKGSILAAQGKKGIVEWQTEGGRSCPIPNSAN